MKSCVHIDILGGQLYVFPYNLYPPSPGNYTQCKDELHNCTVCRLYCVQAVHCQSLCQYNIIYNVEDSLSPPHLSGVFPSKLISFPRQYNEATRQKCSAFVFL